MNLRRGSWLGSLAAALLALEGCNETVVIHSPSSGSVSGAMSTSGPSGSANGTSTGSSSGGSSGSSGGSTTGTPPPTFVDGGFVFCTLQDTGDGNPVSWLCPPGTYFCDPGNAGNCFQCQSDADCRDQSLPTYDPRRPRCDLDSGIPGYQSFCQQCLDNADCVGNPAGAICDVNPTYPLDTIEGVPASSLEPPIETLGFETCQKLQIDCRLDGGPDCQALGDLCDPASGICRKRTASCAADEDCAGLLSSVQTATGFAATLRPFCVSGTCNACDGGLCPNGYCTSDADCGNPDGSPGGRSCDPMAFLCVCTSSSQCPGFWPVCTGLDAGQLTGLCGCASDADCGDGGLACLPGTDQSNVTVSFCGVPCTAPDFPSCSSFMQGDVCDPVTGLCSTCTNDLQCAQDPYAGGPRCSTAERGTEGPCGCLSDSECPTGWSCDAPRPIFSAQSLSLGVCTPAMSRCTPSSCGGYFCNWQDGGCVNGGDVGTVPSCLDDYDCGVAAFCISGDVCTECRTNADCRMLGQAGLEGASGTYCCQAGSPDCPNGNSCLVTCGSDADCVGNPNGAGCTSNYNTTQCGCKSDQDCAGVAHAPRCDLQSPDDPGVCECSANADCLPGQTCRLEAEAHSVCTSSCAADSDCLTGFFCHPTGTCLPRCDTGHACLPPDPVCDVGNLFGDNGPPDGGASWCYACIHGDDCGGGLGCDTGFDPPFCGTCGDGLTGCGSRVCLNDGFCHPACDAVRCPAGQVCDTLNLTGSGPNLCYGCVTAADCPNGEGCDHLTHTCGKCEGPTASGAPSDCPPDAVCSNYWGGPPGVCLQNCDRVPCPEDRPLCRTFPSLTPDHAYCFGCLSDSDCSDAGPGARCDTSVDLTFTCQP